MLVTDILASFCLQMQNFVEFKHRFHAYIHAYDMFRRQRLSPPNEVSFYGPSCSVWLLLHIARKNVLPRECHLNGQQTARAPIYAHHWKHFYRIDYSQLKSAYLFRRKQNILPWKYIQVWLKWRSARYEYFTSIMSPQLISEYINPAASILVCW